MFFQTIVASGLAALALANPVARQTEPCSTTFTGILAANYQGASHPPSRVLYNGPTPQYRRVEVIRPECAEPGLVHRGRAEPPSHRVPALPNSRSRAPLRDYAEWCASSPLPYSAYNFLIVLSGRVFVPSKNKCIAITNQANAVGPYYTTLADCNTEYPQRWVVDLNNNNALRWVRLPLVSSEYE